MEMNGERPAKRQAVSHGGSKITREQVGLLVLSFLLAATAIMLYRILFEFLRAKDHLRTLREENQALRMNLTDSYLQSICWRNNIEVPTMAGWELHGGKCYYFSSTRSSWEESRCWCQSQGGDMVKVEGIQEQILLDELITRRMDFAEDLFWIGLTDAEVEGEWVWVDGSPLKQSFTFWCQGEPNNWNGEGTDGEDCARMGQKPPLSCWYDRSCRISHRFVCQKQAEAGNSTCV